MAVVDRFVSQVPQKIFVQLPTLILPSLPAFFRPAHLLLQLGLSFIFWCYARCYSVDIELQRRDMGLIYFVLPLAIVVLMGTVFYFNMIRNLTNTFTKAIFLPQEIIPAPLPIEDQGPILSLQEKVKRDIQFVIMTTGQAGFQREKLPFLFDTWLKGYEDIIHIVSDTDNNTDRTGRILPGFVNSLKEGCKDVDRHWGLICKNRMYLRRWMELPELKEKKWFFRVMDDTYIHMANLYDYVSKLDHRVPMAIGDRWCHSGGWTYPSGGPGILFSRGFIEKFDLDRWEKTPSKWNSGDDDVSWGGYIKDSGIILTHHHGISQTPPYRGGQPTNAWADMMNKKVWDLPFRPVAWHMEGHSDLMPRLHEEMRKINFTHTAPAAEMKPNVECQCFPKVYHRCVPFESSLSNCKDGAWLPTCFLG